MIRTCLASIYDMLIYRRETMASKSVKRGRDIDLKLYEWKWSQKLQLLDINTDLAKDNTQSKKNGSYL